jgi:hypothetical protein
VTFRFSAEKSADWFVLLSDLVILSYSFNIFSLFSTLDTLTVFDVGMFFSGHF